MDRTLKLNDLLTVGTHNSYKAAIPGAVLALVRAGDPDHADEIDYRHRPLSEQLDAGARQLEIDIYNDPEGGRFLDPVGLRVAGVALDPARRAALAEPGFKVMHIQDVDVLSSCITLRACLGIVRRWLLAHPDHAPIMLMFNAKTDNSPVPGGTTALPFDAAAFDALDREVRAVFPPQELITPDDVQGTWPTLREAVLHDAWPTLGQARGKILFALDEGPDKVALYRGKRRSLEGRVFFVNTDEASPAAAYLTLNDPIAEGDRIRKAVAAGFIVRTRADAGTIEARQNDTRRRDAALASGAQFVSTDYLWPEPRLDNAYRVRLPGGAAAVCNPVRTAGRCKGLAIETAGAASNDYLSPEAMPDGVRILPPPPAAGSPRQTADHQVFAATRRLQGTPRWAVAISDVHTGAFEHFACALGVTLTPRTAPALAHLLDRAGTVGIVDPVKQYYHVRRPYLGTKAPICEPKTAHLAGNGDFPSGHAAGGWMEALILAELAPDRATEILARGRAFGESRLICGAHSLSAVEAGWLAGAASTAALHGSPAFRADMEAARTELAMVRANAPAPDSKACRAEAAALAKPAY
ncbi:Ca2+-dependent phosphoinositide-specific phospholipase C [Sphingomonas sp. MMS24-J13]|uniref:Ca2+-dependent phosphoinositide-specific phospholipase C n=1 Tax=Sphingomonas sp. MMS24-J13 TaxID=3238686 RepID=UPI00384D7308